jgi:hypothetical protein
MEEQIRDLIARYLASQIDRSGFSQEFAGLYFQVRNDRNASLKARQLCDVVVLPFAELSRGHRTEQSFRAELENAIRPFASRIEARMPEAGTAVVVLEFPAGYPRSQMLSVAAGNNNAPIEFPRQTNERGVASSLYLLQRMPVGRSEVGNALADTDSAIEGIPLRAVPA